MSNLEAVALSMDAQLSATEIVRRCERRIGELIREGQAEGTILKPGEQLRRSCSPVTGEHVVKRPIDFLTRSELSGDGAKQAGTGQGIYALTDGSTPDDFERALATAKAERNLSRANVVRKIRGTPTPTSTDRHEVQGYQLVPLWNRAVTLP